MGPSPPSISNQFLTWTKHVNHTFRTKSLPSIEPPFVDIGFFEKLNKTVNVFWQPLPWHKVNGPNVTYEVQEKNYSLKPKRYWAQTGAEFEVPSNYSVLIFEMHGVNALGRSNKSSIVRVQEKNNLVSCAYHFKTVKRNSTLYSSEWLIVDEIENISIFWCTSRSRMHQSKIVSNECDGPMKFQRLHKKHEDYVINSEIPIIIGLSCNYKSSSSGIQWSQSNRILFRLIAINATSIALSWEPIISLLDMRTFIKAVREHDNIQDCLIYCALKDELTLKCVKSASEQRTSDSKIVLTGLKPNSMYKIERSISPCYEDLRISCFSEPMIVQTNESATTPPRSLRVESITNASALLIWKIPEQLNGNEIFGSCHELMRNPKQNKNDLISSPNMTLNVADTNLQNDQVSHSSFLFGILFENWFVFQPVVASNISISPISSVRSYVPLEKITARKLPNAMPMKSCYVSLSSAEKSQTSAQVPSTSTSSYVTLDGIKRAE